MLEASASREIRLDIEDLAEITFSGGAQDARDALQQFQTRWGEELQPVLVRAKVATLEELVHIVTSAEQLSNEIREADRAASQLEQRAADQPDWAGVLAQRQLKLASANEALGSTDRRELEETARQLGFNLSATALDRRLTLLRDERLKSSDAEGTLNGNLIAARAKSLETQKSLTTASDDLRKAQSLIQGNVVPTPKDIYPTRSLDNNALIQPESRQAFARLLAQGWTDAMRKLHPGGPLWTFWDYKFERWQKDKGMRLDHFLLSLNLSDWLVDGGVDRWARGQENASDHAPTWIMLDL